MLDGAMGTIIMRQNLDEDRFRSEQFKDHPVALKGCNDVLVLTRPDLIREIHTAYLNAGADIITTNTFNANPLSLAAYQLASLAKEISSAGARLAREAAENYALKNHIEADRRPLVAGSMGPSCFSLTKGVGVDFDAMADACAVHAAGLIEGGVDILLLETVFDLQNARAALVGIRKAFEQNGKVIPLIISATLTDGDRLYSGETIEEFVSAMLSSGAVVLGLNCGNGVEGMTRQIERLAAICPVNIAMFPNAGLPDAKGNYNETPERMLRAVKPLLEKGIVNIIGGCCGTTPEHIRLIAQAVKNCNIGN